MRHELIETSRRHFTTLAAVLLIMLATVLLTARQAGFTWAGGNGRQAHQIATVNDETFRRGEVIDSAGQTRYAVWGDTELWLDTNTQVKLIDGRPGVLTANVLQGRIVAKGPITITTRNVRTNIEHSATFVHYSWRDEIDIIPLDGDVQVVINDDAHKVREPIRQETRPPYTRERISFSPEQSASADFYADILPRVME